MNLHPESSGLVFQKFHSFMHYAMQLATFLNKQRKLYSNSTPIEYIASRKIIPLHNLPKPTAISGAK